MNQKEKSRQEYKSRINRVMDFVDKNLDHSLDLKQLADISHFSPYHFHRLFTAITGETPNNYIFRIRIEKAAQLLKDNRNITISDVSYRCGFNNASTFSRAFRKHFGLTAKEFHSSEKAVFTVDGIQYSKDGQVLSKHSQKHAGIDSHLCGVEFKNYIIMDTKIEIKTMPELKVIYCRHQGAFHEIYKAYDKVCKWAAPRGLLNFPETKTMTIYHDDPSITEIEKVRQDACITVNEDVKVEGEIGKMTVAGGKYAVGRFEIGVMEFQQAWNTMCLWFTESGYEPADGCTYELYYNDHNQHPEKKFILDICIPVKLL